MIALGDVAERLGNLAGWVALGGAMVFAAAVSWASVLVSAGRGYER